mmetsp:Transcript_3658/g.7854  ORF Transcript_3658/g.7854 Transcript_3658/m.7854 type:complete len:101 (-) Transcript_3658:333-635(-)
MDSLPEGNLKLQLDGVALTIIDDDGQSTEFGKGSLYLADRYLSWRSPMHTFTKAYQEFGLHAISSDPTNYGQPCLYCQKQSDNQVEQWLFVPEDKDSREG